MSEATVRAERVRWPWILFCVFGVAALLGIPMSMVNGTGLGGDIPFVVAFSAFGLVGAMITSRDPGNRIGLLFLFASLVAGVGFLGSESATLLDDRGVDAPVLIFLLALLGEAAWVVGMLPVLILLPLLFPNGLLPSPRWRALLWLTVASVIFGFFAFVLGSPTLGGSAERTQVTNPFYLSSISSVTAVVEGVFFWCFLGLLGASVVSLILRFRRSEGVERQQITWFALAVVLFLIAVTTSEVLLALGIESRLIDTLLVAPAFLALPASVGVAVLRYRLYDLDVVVRKTLLYGFLVAIATVVYVVIVVGVGTLVGRESPFLTMVAAVIVAVGFQPARARLTRLADRIVYGSRATPYEVLAEFSERVGEAYAADDVLPRMARIVGEGVGADHADVWLRFGHELRLSASWPAGAGEPAERLLLVDGALPPVDGGDLMYPVEHRGELLGALLVAKPAAEPATPSDEKLVGTLASHAGLVLRNVRLTEELRARLADLKAAQRRIVLAQDEERRRLERNIHDGAQQQLVALAVKARLAKQLTERDPAKAVEMLDQIEAETQSALEDLRDLARGIYPPLLADRGLVAAIEAQSRKSGLGVAVNGDGLGRFPAEIEATVYFCALEALQNVAKYADAAHTRIHLARANGTLSFEVVDDGRGFDPAVGTTGSGLQGMADRLAAVGGSLDVSSAPGRGTTVAGHVPVDGD